MLCSTQPSRLERKGQPLQGQPDQARSHQMCPRNPRDTFCSRRTQVWCEHLRKRLVDTVAAHFGTVDIAWYTKACGQQQNPIDQPLSTRRSKRRTKSLYGVGELEMRAHVRKSSHNSPSISTITAVSTEGWRSTSRTVAPSPPPPMNTFLGFGCAHIAGCEQGYRISVLAKILRLRTGTNSPAPATHGRRTRLFLQS